MYPLEDTIEEKQDHFNAARPLIVVVGDQAAGKRALIEHIVGKPFLPQGTGTVTKCPLLIKLVRTEDCEDIITLQNEDCDAEYTDISLVREELEVLTAQISGVCFTSIDLKITSPTVLSMSLVDMPSLEKVPEGARLDDMGYQIRELILTYIQNPHSIILVVLPGNEDITKSESFKIAKQVDPLGKRTLVVLTKLDLMDEGTDAWDKLSGDVISAKLGIINVVNRSHRDIRDEKSIMDSLQSESEFFYKPTNVFLNYTVHHTSDTVCKLCS